MIPLDDVIMNNSSAISPVHNTQASTPESLRHNCNHGIMDKSPNLNGIVPLTGVKGTAFGLHYVGYYLTAGIGLLLRPSVIEIRCHSRQTRHGCIIIFDDINHICAWWQLLKIEGSNVAMIMNAVSSVLFWKKITLIYIMRIYYMRHNLN